MERRNGRVRLASASGLVFDRLGSQSHPLVEVVEESRYVADREVMPPAPLERVEVFDLRLVWALQVSNPRPLPCEPEKTYPSASPNSRFGWSRYAR